MVKSLLSLDKKTGLAPVEISSIATDNVAKKDSGRTGRISLLALIIGFGGFLAWAALAPLDEGVPATGMVAIDTKRKAVQHLSGGLVQEVLVREGDEVQEGQLLIRLDSAVAHKVMHALNDSARPLGLARNLAHGHAHVFQVLA